MTVLDAQVLQASRALLSGHSAGIFTLPTALLTADANVRYVDSTPTAPSRSWNEALEAAATQLATGGQLDLEGPMSARRDEHNHQVASLVHRRAAELAREALTFTLRSTASEVIIEHLRPAHDAAVQEARSAAERLQPLHPSASAQHLLGMPKRTRDAWRTFHETTETWTSIRTARGALAALIRPPTDNDYRGLFAETRNTDTIRPWITSAALNSATDHDDLPTRQQDRLAWYLDHDADLWLPTPAEQEDQWQRVFGPLLDRRRTLAVTTR